MNNNLRQTTFKITDLIEKGSTTKSSTIIEEGIYVDCNTTDMNSLIDENDRNFFSSLNREEYTFTYWKDIIIYVLLNKTSRYNKYGIAYPNKFKNHVKIIRISSVLLLFFLMSFVIFYLLFFYYNENNNIQKNNISVPIPTLTPTLTPTFIPKVPKKITVKVPFLNLAIPPLS